jgi:hypothetical protein
MRIAATAAAGEADALDPAEAGLSREAIVRWSGVACLYAGTAAALACLWSPV